MSGPLKMPGSGKVKGTATKTKMVVQISLPMIYSTTLKGRGKPRSMARGLPTG